MRMTSLRINQFGRFDNQKISFPGNGFVIVYGENEAGKSTLMKFITYLLFGFPAKSECGPLLRNGDEGRFGGAVTFVADDGRKYTLARLFTENNHPRLYAETKEGTTIEMSADNFFKNMDRLLYNAVFCFDLEGLKGLDKMKPADLNRFLLDAGMMGSRELPHLEQMIDKRLAELFKPSGRKPIINQLFARLQDRQKELKKWDKKMDQYRDLKEKINEGRRALAAIAGQKKAIENAKREWTTFSALKPLMLSYERLKEEASVLEKDEPFPEHGRERYEKWETQVVVLEGQQAEIRRKIRQIEEDAGSDQANEAWLSEEGRILGLVRKTPKHEHLLQEVNEIKEKKQEADRLLAQLLGKLGTGWTVERLREAAEDVAFKARLKKMLEERKRMMERKDDGERALSIQGTQIRQLKDKQAALKDKALANNERQELEKKAYEQRQRMESEWAMRESLPTRERGSAGSTENKRRMLFPAAGFLLTLIFAFIASYTVSTKAAWFVFIAGVSLSLLFAFAFSALLRDLRRKAAMPLPRFENETGQRQLEARIEEDSRRQVEIQLSGEQLAQAKKRYEQMLSGIEHAEDDLIRCEGKISEWLRDRGYFIQSIDGIEDTVKLVEEGKRLLHQIEAMERKRGERENERADFERERQQILQCLQLDGGDAVFLEKRLMLEKQRQMAANALQGQRDNLIKQDQAIGGKLARYREECRKLLALSGTEDSEVFFAAAARADRLKNIREKLAERSEQMRQAAGSEDMLEHHFQALKDGKWEGISEADWETKGNQFDRQGAAVNERLIAWQVECENLEKNQSYRDLLDDYEAALAELKTASREWAVFQTAKRALEETKNHYREQKLPKVLSAAEGYFRYITEDAYVAVHLDENAGFAAERKDGRVFFAAEMSRGTAEQLYLSLRLALASVFDGEETLPIIIDDSLVNFDRQRRRQALALLSEVARRRQVILLTCHQSGYLQHPDAAILSLGGRP